MKRLQRGIGLLLLLAGLTAFLAPDLYSLIFQQQTKEVVREFREAHQAKAQFEAAVTHSIHSLNIVHFLSRRLLSTTQTLLSAMQAAPIIGLTRPNAATGTASRL